jgi:CRP-like cAMP-binding protein
MASLDRSLIADLPMFAELAGDQLDEILAEAESVRYPKGADVFEQDAPARWFYILLQGYLRVAKLTPAGQQVVVRIVSPGDIFGLANAIGRTTYPGTATAIVDSVALAWPSAAWPRLVGNNPALAANAFQTVGSRLQEAHARIVEMSTEQVERRVARALLRLARQAGRNVEEGVRIDFPISRQDIAEMTGTTLHTVSRILSAWEEKGWVEGGRQMIVIREAHKLSELAEGDR